MFGFLKKKTTEDERNQIAELLKVSPEALLAFEKAYQNLPQTDADDLFKLNAKQASTLSESGVAVSYDQEKIDSLCDRIVTELFTEKEAIAAHVTGKEIEALPKELRPQLTGTLIAKDIAVPAYPIVLDMYMRFLKEKNPAKKQQLYGLFRQGLDIQDLDPVLYEVLGMNPNSMGFWLPALTVAVEKEGFFKIPETKVIKVPLPILQLTRLDWFSLTPATKRIVNDFCMKAFDLDVTKTYFVKTGTYSSKYDFRNAVIRGEKEVRELGEYLLFIHYQANQMAAPLNIDPETGEPRCIYGVSTTNEWVVREFVEDVENNPYIYHGLPLRNEIRVFVDFDTDEVLGVAPYWKPELMLQHFGKKYDMDPDARHDYLIFKAHEGTLLKKYEASKEAVLGHIMAMLPDIELPGQWSIDIMQNGEDFYVIDMALAANSALKECVPAGKLRVPEENWLPDFSSKKLL